MLDVKDPPKPMKPAPVDSKVDPETRLIRVHKEISTAVEVIGPDEAAQYLESQTQNRHVSQRRVDDYERQMAEDRWMLNGETMVFDWFDRLLDGQHRCWAVVNSKKKIKCLVVRGVDPATFVTMDTGSARDAQDLLSIRKEGNVIVLAGVLRFVWRWELYQRYQPILTARKGVRKGMKEEDAPITKRWGTKYTPSPREIEEVLTRHPNVRTWATRANNKIVPKVPLGFVMYWLSCLGWDDATILGFKERLCEGAEMKSDDPIFRCHKRFLEARLGRTGGRRPIDTLEAAALIIKAWNHKLNDNKIQQIMWRGDEEYFPEPFQPK